MTTLTLMSRRGAPLLLALTLAGARAGELEDAAPPLRLSGFGTLALTHNDNSGAAAIFSSAQRRPARAGWSANLDSVLGLQLEWQAADATSVVLQGVARSGDDLHPQLRMGYLRQQLNGDLALRLGRIRSPLYFDSDVAEIGYAYLLARPALPLYGFANSVAGLDGGDLQWRRKVGDVAVLAQAYYGRFSYQHRFYNLEPVQAAEARVDAIRGLALSATLPSLTLRASHTETGSYTMRSPQVEQFNAGAAQLGAALQAASGNPYLPPPLATALAARAQAVRGLSNPFDSRPSYSSVGFDASVGDWRWLGEWTRLDAHAALVGKYQGWQLTAGRSFDELTAYVALARQRRLGGTLDTSALAASGLDPALDAGLAQLRGGLDEAARHADLSTRSFSAGLRYDFRDKLALKLQYDRLQTPGPWTPGYFAVARLPIRPTVHLVTLSLDFVF